MIENVFGILVARWEILLTTINIMPENFESIVLAYVTLHNFVKLNSLYASVYCPETFADWENASNIIHTGIWRNEIQTTLLSVKVSVNQH